MKRFLKYFFIGSILFAGGIALLFYRPRYLRRWISSDATRGVLFHVDTNQRLIALTIDDGPHHMITPQILDVLDLYGVNATFFLLGENVNGNETLVERMIADGHEIGNHMLDDQRSILLKPEEFERQITAADQLLREFGEVHWYRPGSGFFDQRMVTSANRLGYQLVIGSVYPYDAQIPAQIDATKFVSNYVLANTTPGAIIVLHDGHDGRSRVIDVLTEIIPQLKADGYEFVTLSELTAQ
ncbi:MAG: polysaccharide deacetylase family protein [Ardenticatenaceae bacterium]|nr:polysaccharide deacetylase family protein [Ardenticatenaceae bacterium]